MTEEQRMARELRSVRPHHDDPIIDFDVDVNELDRVARNELKTLTKENAETVAKHLVMAVRLIDSDPELAHQHVLSASRRAGRIAVVRETLGITAYATGDFALALREMRTFRRISGSNEQIALMVDSERGVGRSDKALELGRSVDRSTLTEATQVALAVAMSGARLDLDQPDLALGELEISQLDPTKAFSYSPELFRAYAEVLEELGRTEESAQWLMCAEVAEKALESSPVGENESDEDIIVIEEEFDDFDDDFDDVGEESHEQTSIDSSDKISDELSNEPSDDSHRFEDASVEARVETIVLADEPLAAELIVEHVAAEELVVAEILVDLESDDESDDENFDDESDVDDSADEVSAADVASLFDEVAVESVDHVAEGHGVEKVADVPVATVVYDFDDDLLEEDVAQVLRDTAHLAQEGEGESRA
jgi:23S rRNA pseudouridine2605 synthase